MSSFSSVVRRPGQKIQPKVAPRRPIQRRAAKEIAPVDALTPESLPQSPRHIEDASASIETVDHPQNETRSIESAQITPPATAHDGHDRAARTPSPSEVPADIQYTEVVSPVRQRADIIPTVSTSQVSPEATRTRRSVPAVQRVEPVYAQPAPLQQSEAHHPPAKRRRLDVPVPDSVIDPQLREPAQLLVPPINSTTTPQIRPVRETDDLVEQFQRVGTSARVVSQISNAINSRNSARKARSRSQRLSDGGSDAEYEQSRSPSPVDDVGLSRSEAIEKAAAAVVARAVRRGKKTKVRHQRGRTPENAEDHKIDEGKTSMLDLINDSGLGMRSETGRRLDDEWTEVKSRWDQKLESNRSKAKLKASQRKAARVAQPPDGEEEIVTNDVAEGVAAGFTIIDGQIRMDDNSRFINFASTAEHNADATVEGDIQDVERIYNYVNQNRIGKHAGLRTKTKWNDELTEKFYQGLRTFGTDFELIAGLFGGDWTRRQIKTKFVREERANLSKVKRALAEREQLNLSGYSGMTGLNVAALIDPKDIQAELDAEEKRIRDEWEKARNGDAEDVVDNTAQAEADQPIESIETDAVAGDEDRDTSVVRQTPTAETNPYMAVAAKIVKNASRPAQKKQQQAQRKQREQTGTSRTGAAGGAGRKSTRGKKPLEGVEERLGTLDDVQL